MKPVKMRLFAQPRFADRELDREGVAVAVERGGDPADPDDLAFACREIVDQILVMPVPVRIGHQHLHVPAGHLGLGIAEHLLGGRAE